MVSLASKSFFFFVSKTCLLGWSPVHLDTGCFQRCFRLKEHPSVSLAFPPVGWQRTAAHTQNYCLCMAKDGGDFIASWAFYIHEIGIGALHQALLLMFPLLQASLFKDSNLRPAALTFLYIPSLDYCEIKWSNIYPLQSSCLENPMDRGAWRAAIHRVAKTWTPLS